MYQKIRFLYENSFYEKVWRNHLGRPCSPKNVEDAGFEPMAEQRRAYDEYVEDVFRRYAEAQENMTSDQEAEKQLEISANFKSGTKVVDLVTGKRWEA